MKQKIIFIILFLLLSTLSALATPQKPDILIYEGKEYPIYNGPLEPFFDKNPDLRPKFCGPQSSLWRGYVAYIEIVEEELELKDIKIAMVNPSDPFCVKESKLSEVVPDGKPFKFNWYSGWLQSGHGEFIGGEDNYSVWKIWEKYSLFQIEKGKLKNVRHFTNEQYQKYLAEEEKSSKGKR